MKTALLGCGAVIAVVLLGSLMVGGCCYNKVVVLRNANTTCDSTFAQVDNMLQRKCDLVPNLVETVKGIAKHEQGIVDSVTKARASLMSASGPVEKSAANEELKSALGRLLVVVENYPNIKSDSHFTQLMDELAGSENRIAVARMDYNKDVAGFNKLLNDPINGFVAGFISLRAREFFQASSEARANSIKVKF